MPDPKPEVPEGWASYRRAQERQRVAEASKGPADRRLRHRPRHGATVEELDGLTGIDVRQCLWDLTEAEANRPHPLVRRLTGTRLRAGRVKGDKG